MTQFNHGPIRILAVAAAASLLLAACGSSTATPAVVVTPTPTPEVTATPTPEATPTADVTATPEVTPTAEVTPAPEATPTATPGVSPTPSPTPSPIPSPTPTSAAAFCSGNAANQAFFLEAAHSVKATIYCATKLPAGWAISTGGWQGTKSGGWMDVSYKYKNTSQTFEIKEGAFCLDAAIVCTGGALILVQPGVQFDGISTSLASYGGPGTYLMMINPGKTNAYFLLMQNVTQAAAIAIGASMKAVPKN
jgi:hypothetical protein